MEDPLYKFLYIDFFIWFTFYFHTHKFTHFSFFIEFSHPFIYIAHFTHTRRPLEEQIAGGVHLKYNAGGAGVQMRVVAGVQRAFVRRGVGCSVL